MSCFGIAIMSAFVLFGAAACFDGASPAQPERGGQVAIAVEEASLSLRGEHGLDVSLRISLRNEGASPILFLGCGSVLEREDGEDWVVVWSEMCLLSGQRSERVELGWAEAYTSTMAFTTTLGRFPSEEWRRPLDGRYRILVPLADERGMLAESARLSDAFRMGTYR